MSVERKRLKSYLEDYEQEDNLGMNVKLENYEGGGGSMPDESEIYESRLEWLKMNKGNTPSNIWTNLAKNELGGINPEEDEELVYIKFPEWLINMDDNDDWKATFGKVYGYHTGWAILDVENSEGKEAWAFKKFHLGGRWKSPRNKYGKLWGPRSCFTLYRREGEPNEMDKTKINDSDALPDNVDPFNAEDDDYDWRLALGAAYRRTKDLENEPLQEAKANAKELPPKLYQRLEIGVDEFMRQSSASNNDVPEEDLAIIINSLTTALEPGAIAKQNK